MKKIILLSLLAVFILVLPATAVGLGTGLAKETADKAGYSKTTTDITLAQTVGTVIKAALSFVGVVFFLLAFYAGYLWMTARGEEEQIKKAQKIITSSIIGLIITVGAYSITNFVVPEILKRTVQGVPIDDTAK